MYQSVQIKQLVEVVVWLLDYYQIRLKKQQRVFFF